MRFHFTFELENEKMDMDYRRKILSFLKYSIEKSDKEFYEKIYSKGQNVNKDFVMSVFFVPDTKISKDSICVKSKKMIINFSTPDSYTGIQIYNAMCRQKFIWYRLSDGNALRVVDINAEKEKLITQDKAVFKLLSPLVIRDHDRNTGKDWFYTFEDSAALDIIKRNMQKEFEGKFSRDISYEKKQ